jgi:hypothetical protein
MKNLGLSLLALATALAISPAAMANTINLAVIGTGVNGFATDSVSVLLNATPGPGSDLTAVGATTGTATFYFNGVEYAQYTVVSVISSGNLIDNLGYGQTTAGNFSGPGTYDDLLLPTGNPIYYTVDSYGIALLLSNGDDLQIYVYAGEPYTALLGPGNGNPVVQTFDTPGLQIGETPEPGSLLLLGTGLLGLAGLVFWKARRPSANMNLSV